MRIILIIIGFIISVMPMADTQSAFAHGGRTAADGCHNDRKNGGRHCHGGNSTPQTVQRSYGSTYYPNCTAARSAGAAPVRRGQPGYGIHLDRDRDGIGCE